MASLQVPDVPDSHESDWTRIHESLGKLILETAYAKLEHHDPDDVSEISMDTTLDMAAYTWGLEVAPLCEALLKIDPDHQMTKDLLTWIDSGRETEDFGAVFASDPLMAELCSRMGVDWMLETFPLAWDSDVTTWTEIAEFHASFELRLHTYLTYSSFGESYGIVCGALGMTSYYHWSQTSFVERYEAIRASFRV
jgi:hypothetical protein